MDSQIESQTSCCFIFQSGDGYKNHNPTYQNKFTAAARKAAAVPTGEAGATIFSVI